MNSNYSYSGTPTRKTQVCVIAAARGASRMAGKDPTLASPLPCRIP